MLLFLKTATPYTFSTDQNDLPLVQGRYQRKKAVFACSFQEKKKKKKEQGNYLFCFLARSQLVRVESEGFRHYQREH